MTSVILYTDFTTLKVSFFPRKNCGFSGIEDGRVREGITLVSRKQFQTFYPEFFSL